MDCFCSDQYSIHESTNERTRGVDNESEEIVQISAESFNKQVSDDRWGVIIYLIILVSFCWDKKRHQPDIKLTKKILV